MNNTWVIVVNYLIKGKKFLQKRFGLDGGESFIPGMKTLIDTASSLGVKSCVIGMAHRGRLNIMGNVVRKPLPAIFREFIEGTHSSFGTGDVKYHLGTSYTRPTRNNNKVLLFFLDKP